MYLTLARSNGAYVGVVLNRFVHEGMNHISNVKVHLKTRSRNVNIIEINDFLTYFDADTGKSNFMLILFYARFMATRRVLNFVGILIQK